MLAVKEKLLLPPAKVGFKDCQNFQPSHVLIIHLFCCPLEVMTKFPMLLLVDQDNFTH